MGRHFRQLAKVALLILGIVILIRITAWAIWTSQVGYFDAWPTWLLCTLSLALFVAFAAVSFFASLKSKPKTRSEWKAALADYIGRFLQQMGNDLYRHT